MYAALCLFFLINIDDGTAAHSDFPILFLREKVVSFISWSSYFGFFLSVMYKCNIVILIPPSYLYNVRKSNPEKKTLLQPKLTNEVIPVVLRQLYIDMKDDNVT